MVKIEETIRSVMKETRRFPPPEGFSADAHISSIKQYGKLYDDSIKDPDRFWKKIAKELKWFRFPKKIFSWDKDKLECRWFEDGMINISYNCLDVHLKDKADKIAIIFQGEEENNVKRYTYRELHKEVCKFANVLVSHNIKKGDRVCLYLSMVPELAVAMLACARIGAVHL